MTLLRANVGLLSALRAPIVDANWPYCDLCSRPLDAVELVEAPSGATFVRVLGKHHGAEQLAQFDFGSVTHDETDIARALRGYKWFQPEMAPNADNDE